MVLEASEDVAWRATSAMVKGAINAQKPEPLIMILSEGSTALIHTTFVFIFQLLRSLPGKDFVWSKRRTAGFRHGGDAKRCGAAGRRRVGAWSLVVFIVVGRRRTDKVSINMALASMLSFMALGTVAGCVAPR